jgi:pre-mRNA-splicing factor CDC5/CEF1
VLGWPEPLALLLKVPVIHLNLSFPLTGHPAEDNVLAEARNLRNMTMAQTPLLGEENTPLHTNATGGTGFEGATPKHQVNFTPNPLATPYRAGSDASAATPRTGISATPLRTPMRDNLSINDTDSNFSSYGQTPREHRLNAQSTQRALQASFLNLPKPENNFELLVPDEEDGTSEERSAREEDAAERDARIKRLEKEEERKVLARRSQAIKLELPRPANVNLDQMLERLNINDHGDLSAAHELINKELAQLLLHDAISYPLPGTTYPGSTRSAYEPPADEDMESARREIHTELASFVGFPNASSEQLHDGLIKLSQAESVDESGSWYSVRKKLAFDPESKLWAEPDTLSPEQRVAGYEAVLQDNKDLMAKEAAKAAKVEKKLGVTLGGYQARSQTLAKRLTDAFVELERVQIDLESFTRLRTNESAVGPRRVASLKEEVEVLERRERLLQERYAELDSERREAQSRIAVLEERVMAEAEALNEAHLAEAEG